MSEHTNVFNQNQPSSPIVNDFPELFKFLSKENLEKEHLSQSAKAWENIPLIIPQSILFLEKNLKKVQSWSQYAEDKIGIVFSGSLTQDLKSGLESLKIQEQEFEERTENQFESIMNKIYSINDIERKRNTREDGERIEETYFGKFFEAEVEPFKEIREERLMQMQLGQISQGEYEEPRRYNIKQLHYIIYSLLNQSKLNTRAKELGDEIKSVEERLEEKMRKHVEDLSFKCSMLDTKIMLEREGLKKELEKKNQNTLDYINQELVPRLAEDEKVIKSSVKNIGELREEIDTLNRFKGLADMKFEQIMKQNDDFHHAFEKKINYYDDNFDYLKHKTEERLQEFLKVIDSKFMKLKQQSEEHVELIKNEFFKFFEENNQRNIATTEKILAKGTKQMQDYDIETKKVLDNFKEIINTFNNENIKRSKDLRQRFDIFIKRFETFSKLKIEPVEGNEARIHAIESKVQEQEEFFSYATLFTKDVVKKLIYAIQKHNTGHIKIPEEEDHSKERRATEQGSSHLAEQKELTTPGNMDPLSGEDSPKFKQTYYQGWGKRNNSSAGTRRGRDNKINFPSIQVEGNSTTSSKQGLEIFPNSTKPQKRKESLDVDKPTPIRKKEEGSSKPLLEFDSVLHRRLEMLRKALIEETRISQNYSNVQTKETVSPNKGNNPPEIEQELLPKKSIMSFYKDIELRKVASNSRPKRKSNHKLNHTVSEFSDVHLNTKDQSYTEGNTYQQEAL